MREIKFRAWLPGIKKMTYAHTLEELMNWNTKIEDNGTAIWLQYTGLKDRNGKEIFEGDIVKQVFHAEARDGQDGWISFDGHHIGEIVITATKGVCMKNPLCYSEETDETTRSNQYKSVAGYRCEVVGNIFEQKESHPEAAQ